jgi:aminoglycoside phosphotransferase (APT) family kinase protein
VGIIRRRKRDKGSNEIRAGDVAEAELGAAATRLDHALATVLGEPPGVTGDDLEPSLGFGTDVFRFDMETDDPRLSGTFLARVGDPAAVAREASWSAAVQGADFPAHRPVLVDPDQGVSVFAEPPGMTLTECMLVDMVHVPRFLASLGELHARLHAVPTDVLTDAGAGGVGAPGPDLLAHRASTDEVRTALADELAWLGANRPPLRDTVACHGELHPAHVYMDPGDTSTALVVNWTAARLAEPELDVAGTTTAFWFSPFYLESAVYRKAMTMARDSVIGAYLDAYRAAAKQPLDDEVLRYWQAWQIAVLASDVAHVVHHGPRDAWDPVVNVIRPERTLADLRDRFQELARP